MSSTNRGSKRVENDFYETPSWCVDAILPHLPLGGRLLDPCAGNGAILNASEHAFSRCFGIEINPVLVPDVGSIRAQRQEWTNLDALVIGFWPLVDVVLMNPPFNKKEEFVSRSIKEQAQHNGASCALLPLGFMASKKRRDFLRANPCDFHVLSKRPSFNGIGTDSCDYAWFVWGPGRGGRWSVL